MSQNTQVILDALAHLTDLPAHVHEWHVAEGLDATDDPAVWVWAIIDEDDFDADNMRALIDRARAAVRTTTPDLWPYVAIRGLHEARPLA